MITWEMPVTMNELDHLRGQLNFAQEEIKYLEERSEEHSFLPITNQRGLTRELKRVISHSEQTKTVNSFLCIYIKNICDIRCQYGRRAARAALIRAVEIISENILESDIIGSLGGADIGVILTVAGKEEAEKKSKQLIKALENKNERLQLQAATGIYVLREGESASRFIDDADIDLSTIERERLGKFRKRAGKSRRSVRGRRKEDASEDDID